MLVLRSSGTNQPTMPWVGTHRTLTESSRKLTYSQGTCGAASAKSRGSWSWDNQRPCLAGVHLIVSWCKLLIICIFVCIKYDTIKSQLTAFQPSYSCPAGLQASTNLLSPSLSAAAHHLSFRWATPPRETPCPRQLDNEAMPWGCKVKG